MPDHVHILATASSETGYLTKFVEAFKQDTGVAFARKTGQHLWQFKYYDRILRRDESLDRVAWYIWMNPVRKGLCTRPTEYPHAGSFTEIGKRLFDLPKTEQWVPAWKRDSSRLPQLLPR